jgi:SEC-C motif-containing protein
MTTPTLRRPIPSGDESCPCGSGRTFDDCCAPVLAQTRKAATAEELMRSRFTAHALGDHAHLHRTDLATAAKPFAADAAGEVEDVYWTRLAVHAHEPGPRPDTAHVDFSAYHRTEDGEGALHEKSEFVRVRGEWYYTRALRMGPAPVRAGAPKVGRNDPCPCGSGKKHKHCCGR